MNRFKNVMLLALVCLPMIGVGFVEVPPAVNDSAIVMGELSYSAISLCGPYHYYVVMACTGPVWLDWQGWPEDNNWHGLQVEVTGSLTVDGACRVLGVEKIVICWPDPVGKNSGDKGD